MPDLISRCLKLGNLGFEPDLRQTSFEFKIRKALPMYSLIKGELGLSPRVLQMQLPLYLVFLFSFISSIYIYEFSILGSGNKVLG